MDIEAYVQPFFFYCSYTADHIWFHRPRNELLGKSMLNFIKKIFLFNVNICYRYKTHTTYVSILKIKNVYFEYQYLLLKKSVSFRMDSVTVIIVAHRVPCDTTTSSMTQPLHAVPEILLRFDHLTERLLPSPLA